MKISMMACSLLVLGGCAQWEELPEGATGFLELRDARLDGTIGGVAVSGRADATGYCTDRGWMIDLRADGAEGSVMSVVDIRELFWAQEDLTAVFRAGPGVEMELERTTSGTVPSDPWGTAAPASAVVEGCSGPREHEWTTEAHAEVAIVDVHFPEWNVMEVTYEAQFPNGDAVQGSFTSRMPFND